jgi:hypothetical protein
MHGECCALLAENFRRGKCFHSLVQSKRLLHFAAGSSPVIQVLGLRFIDGISYIRQMLQLYCVRCIWNLVACRRLMQDDGKLGLWYESVWARSAWRQGESNWLVLSIRLELNKWSSAVYDPAYGIMKVPFRGQEAEGTPVV